MIKYTYLVRPVPDIVELINQEQKGAPDAWYQPDRTLFYSVYEF